jgi:hypothetical protein
MSEVISFRLDRNNPREAQALGVLKKGQEAGYSLRHVLTEALLALEASAEEEQAVAQVLLEVADRLEQIQSALEQFRHMKLTPAQPQNNMSEQAVLAESFVLAVKNAAKPGMTFNE